MQPKRGKIGILSKENVDNGKPGGGLPNFL